MKWPVSHKQEIDLVLDGGGIRGIGHVGAIAALGEAGYGFHRIAGVSAGAIVAALVAAGVSPADLRQKIEDLNFKKFRDYHRPNRGGVPKGLHRGEYLRSWLTDSLAEQGVRTFADLRLPGTDNKPIDKRYRLVVTTTDVTRSKLVRLPWDYAEYGLNPDEQLVAEAVRASASLPLFFQPVLLEGSYLVDGGLLAPFPITIFDSQGLLNRWPTVGIKLSANPSGNRRINEVRGPLSLATAIIRTMVNSSSHETISDTRMMDRIIFVDIGDVSLTDLRITPQEQKAMYDSGYQAAEQYLGRTKPSKKINFKL